MTILVCGGAGYIGSHFVDFIKDENTVIVIDDLSTGFAESLPKNVIFYNTSLSNKINLHNIFSTNNIDCVIHFAALSIVKDSMKDSYLYYEKNINETLSLLSIMNTYNVKNLVFSSTAAVYGNPLEIPIKEISQTNPINVYGETKLIIENLIKWSSKIYNINYIIFRYFNAAGASLVSNIGEAHKNETHLIPTILESVLKNKPFYVYGNSYNTKDGTCIRDYVHVTDIANAHYIACKKLLSEKCNEIYNLGNSLGNSILDIISEVEYQLNTKIDYTIKEKRDGDPDILIADISKVRNDLQWQPLYNLEKIISSAISWHKNKLY